MKDVVGTVIGILLVSLVLSSCSTTPIPKADNLDSKQFNRKSKGTEKMNSEIVNILEELKNSGRTPFTRNLQFEGHRYFFVSVERGSGLYLPEGYLYDMTTNEARLLLHVPPDSGRISLDAVVKGKSIVILTRLLSDPENEVIVTQYYPE